MDAHLSLASLFNLGAKDLWVILLIVVLFFMQVWLLVDCVKRETDVGNRKLIWVLAIVYAPYGLGMLAYLFTRKLRRPQTIG